MTDYIPPAPEGAPHPPAYVDKASGMAITTLVLGILSMPCCCGSVVCLGPILSIAALILGFKENGKINSGLASPKGKWMAITGMILGGIGILAGLIYVLWVAFFGGIGVLQGLMNR
jgi:hypothetical protein